MDTCKKIKRLIIEEITSDLISISSTESLDGRFKSFLESGNELFCVTSCNYYFRNKKIVRYPILCSRI